MIINQDESKHGLEIYFQEEEDQILHLDQKVAEYLKDIKMLNKDGAFIFLSADYENYAVVCKDPKKTRRRDDIYRGFLLGKQLKAHNLLQVDLRRMPYDEKRMPAFVEGLIQAEFSYKKYVEDKTAGEFTITLPKDCNTQALTEMMQLMQGVIVARDLVNEPANVLTPTEFGNRVKELFKDTEVKVELIAGKEKIKELGMEAYLSVAKGSDEEPVLMIMKYLPEGESVQPIGIVGKAITYDSGGYCIKPPTGMVTMHCDMGGAGAAIGTLVALEKNKVKKNVVVVCTACENMISGHAYRTGDIISSYRKKSIFVENTDAEGRLTLVDAIAYCEDRFKPSSIIDMATLTGAAVVALGFEYTAMVTNNQELADKMKVAADSQSEKVWQLPLDDEFRAHLKSDVADVSNIGARKGAGTIVAGAFLEAFVEKTPWLHLDIAGTAYLDSKEEYLPKRATGAPVKALYQLVKNEVK